MTEEIKMLYHTGSRRGRVGQGYFSVHQEMAVNMLSMEGFFPLYFTCTYSLKDNGSFEDN